MGYKYRTKECAIVKVGGIPVTFQEGTEFTSENDLSKWVFEDQLTCFEVWIGNTWVTLGAVAK